MIENYFKALAANMFLLGNTMVQWMSNADTALKLLATVIALPTAYYTARYMRMQFKIKQLEMRKLESELTDSAP